MTVRIGITGPIGCGKSTVAGWLGDMGAVVIDADAVARAVTEDDVGTRSAIIDAFGPAILSPSGGLDRAALAKIVFAHPADLARLEAIVHPAVRRSILASMARAESAAADAIVIEAIKLVEGGLANACDEVWLVTCEPDMQLERLAMRGMTSSDAASRIAAQAQLLDVVEPVATRVIDTSRTFEATRIGVAAAYAAALAGATDDGPRIRDQS
ncbi:MAG: dephospho-CoA kinase [Chloroflexota bacterium]